MPLVLAVVLLCVEIAAFVALGDLILRFLGYGAVWRRFPEFCFLLGLPAFAVCAYPILALTTVAQAILPSVFLLAVAARIALKRRPPLPSLDLPELCSNFARFRASPSGKLCCLIVALSLAPIVLSHYSWLAESVVDGRHILGTRIGDDMRTVGFPIALAATGYPLQNPLNSDTTLMYTLGPFLFPSAVILLLPRFPLSAIFADTIVGGLYFALSLALAASVVASAPSLRILFCLSAVFSTPYNLAQLRWLEPWMPLLKPPRSDTSKAFSTLFGLICIENHALGLAALLAAALLLPFKPPRLVILLLTVYAAITSLDMTVFALGAAILWIVWVRWRHGEWHRPLLEACCAAVLATVLVVAPSLTGKMDGFAVDGMTTKHLRWLIGCVISTEGGYLPVLLLAIPFASLKPARPVLFATLVLFAFVLCFTWGSHWFYRGHFALHPILAMLTALLLSTINPARIRNAIAVLWAVVLIPGIVNGYQETVIAANLAPRLTSAQAEVVRWIYGNTRLNHRVVAWKPRESSLVPSVDYLRAGSRSGKTVYDRDHVVVGFFRNLELMSDLPRGVASNDYIIYAQDDPAFLALLTACRAPVVFHNAAAAIYRIDAVCRANLTSAAVAQANATILAARAELDARRTLAEAAVADFSKAPPEAIAAYLSFNPEEIFRARQLAADLWAKRQFPEAIAFLTLLESRLPPSGEIQYCLAFSYQQTGAHADAVAHYSRALELDYAEFWVRYNRAQSYLPLGEKQKAIDDLSRAARLDPKHPGPPAVLKTIR